ncbi:OLC1v1006191C1 [Oldenlandia corymbosa var. corymbosa]|uniref:OLC1v1006191C1 n=1 Tax=Oldenlandia corymbosa var. corymbosa TaxID=529605 RepID=A0AAV1DGR6_OLDCO|nr:OLC1v1006191C1 [Oldenlandia corymbosa var. corymbosa]
METASAAVSADYDGNDKKIQSEVSSGKKSLGNGGALSENEWETGKGRTSCRVSSTSLAQKKGATKVILPDELLLEILIRLPGKELGRCKCVCKSWRFDVVAFTTKLNGGDHSAGKIIRREIKWRDGPAADNRVTTVSGRLLGMRRLRDVGIGHDPPGKKTENRQQED